MSGTDLERYDKIVKLNRPGYQAMEDAEQVSFIEQWHIDHPKGDYSGYILLIAVGILMVVATVCYIRLSQPVAFNMTPCITCHNYKFYPPADLTTYKKYRTFHASKIQSVDTHDAMVLADLVRP